MESTFLDFDSDFQKDFDTRYKSKGFDYERYRPMYQYGWEAGNRFSDRGWEAIEPKLREDWVKNYPGDVWEDLKDAVQAGFEHSSKQELAS